MKAKSKGPFQNLPKATSALLLLLLHIFIITCATALKIGETCATNGNCDSGLHCETCVANGNVRPRCTRIRPLSPTSKVRGLPFDRYSWLTTHNSFARLGVRSGTGGVLLTPTNQQDSITDQLNPAADFGAEEGWWGPHVTCCAAGPGSRVGTCRRTSPTNSKIPCWGSCVGDA